MMKRWPSCFLILILCLSLLFPAQAELTDGSRSSRILVAEEGVEFIVSSHMKEWTFVTPENLEEYMEMLTGMGETEADIRARFSDGTILFEAYHKKGKKNWTRAQVFEDEYSRNIWHLDDLTKKQYIAVAEDLEDHYFQGYLDLFDLYYYSSATRGREFTGDYNAYPPYQFESAKFCLRFLNGKAYLQTGTGTLGIYLTGERLPAITDLKLEAGPQIHNANSGNFTFQGLSEKNARITLKIGERQWEATADADGKYAADIQLLPDDSEITLIANKDGLKENVRAMPILVNDAFAALVLSEYPAGDMIRDDLRVSGRTNPGAAVMVQIDEEEPINLAVDENGAFSQKLEAEDWKEHIIRITAREEGKQDYTAISTFVSGYADAEKGISAYRKTLTEGLTAKKIHKDPYAHVGGRIKLEVYTRELIRENGQMIIKGNIYQNKDMPITLVCDSYLQDRIKEKMILTVYGEVMEPLQQDDPVSTLKVEYISYLKYK